MPGLITPKARALRITARGGQILLPSEAGDAQITFSSRRELTRLIEKEIVGAIRAEFLKRGIQPLPR